MSGALQRLRSLSFGSLSISLLIDETIIIPHLRRACEYWETPENS